MKFLIDGDEGSPLTRLLFGVLGAIIVLGIWVYLTSGTNPVFPSLTLPSPWRVFHAFGDLYTDNDLIPNVGFSIALNLSGYVEAILVAIPVGFIIGLIKYAKWGFQRQVDAIRYIPLTALIPLFILWFGIGAPMKVHFLAFGILIYLLPVMIQRIQEVDDIYLKTVHTLGASSWQTLRSVYFPSVLSRLSDDIRVLTAISWTYIIVAEGLASQGGIGNLIWTVGFKQGRADKVFALVIIIMIIGLVQDKLFQWLDRELFPHKYQAIESIKSSRIKQTSLFGLIVDYIFSALAWIAVGVYFILFLNEFLPILGSVKPLSYLFGDPVWGIHMVMIFFLLYKGWKWYDGRTDHIALQKVKPA